MLRMAYYLPSPSQQNYHHSKTLEIDVGVGKTGFASHTKPTVEITQGSTSFMRDNM